MTPLALAIEFATRVHDGLADKAGAPYILHPLRVMDAAFRAKLGDDGMIVAVLHDTMEDTPEDIEKLMHSVSFSDFSNASKIALRAITRLTGESYFDYIRRCKANDLARRVKLLDLADNMAAWRLRQLSPEQSTSLARRYAKATSMLMDVAP